MTECLVTLAMYRCGEIDPLELTEWRITPRQYEGLARFFQQFGPGRRVE